VSFTAKIFHFVIIIIPHRRQPRLTGHHPHFSQHHQSSTSGQTSATLNSSIVPVQPGKINKFYFIFY
jgi:hypothetical protein